jgi:hypothetical protein
LPLNKIKYSDLVKEKMRKIEPRVITNKMEKIR